MTRVISLILSLMLLVAGSCTERKSKADKSNLIPEKDLIPLLVDIQITDGLLSIPRINAWSSSLDSITSYIQVIEKHGYTKEVMDKTMKYYFINEPKELNKIYDQVLGILSEMDARAQKQAVYEAAHSQNQWPGKDFYAFPGTNASDSAMFDLQLKKPGVYTLSFTAVLYPDDQSFMPKATIYTCSPDSIETGKRVYSSSIEFLKDGSRHEYHIPIQTSEKSLYIRGWLINNNSSPAHTVRHLLIDNISISYTSNVAL